MKRLNSLLSLLAIAAMVAACGGPATTPPPTAEPIVEPSAVPDTPVPAPSTPEPEKGPTVGGSLVWALPGEPDTLDMHNTASGASWRVMYNVGCSLVARDPDGNAVPYVAEKWEVSDDGLAWTFTLRDDITFHDGTALTADDVVWTYQRAVSPDVHGGTASLLGPIQSFEAVDDYTLRIHLAIPYFPLLTSLAEPSYMMIMSPEAVEAAGEAYGRNPVGCGPYKFKEWVTGDRIVLERNPDFNWGPAFAHEGPWYINEIEFRIIPESATQVAGLEAGELDAAVIDANDVKLLEETGRFTIHETLAPGAAPYLQYNVTAAPFDDVRVRQAINLAVDREVLVKVVTQGNAVVQYGPMSSATVGYWPEIEDLGYHYNLDKAKALMEEAGFTYNAEGMLEKDGAPFAVTLKTLSVPVLGKSAEVLQAQFKALGIQVELEQVEPGVLMGDMLGGNYQMGMLTFGWPEADILYLMFHSSGIGSLNFGLVQDPELDALLEKTRSTTDPELRQQLVNDAQKYIVEKAYMVSLFATKIFLAVSNRVEGEAVSTGPILFTHDAYISDAGQ
jgi:peptide/nickel transport system substrate-binding protein